MEYRKRVGQAVAENALSEALAVASQRARETAAQREAEAEARRQRAEAMVRQDARDARMGRRPDIFGSASDPTGQGFRTS